MKTDLLSVFEAACVAGAIALVGCSSSTTSTADGGAGCPAGCPAADGGAGCPATSTPGDAQTPPTGTDTAISAWIAKGEYKAWKCESAPHENRSPSPHGKNRICSNTALSGHGTGEFPVGAASVKELYDAAGTSVIGYATAVKTAKGGGDAWYWFEKTAKDGLIANGLGTSGTPKTVCVGCHAGAGSDAMHSGHDQVYTQVK